MSTIKVILEGINNDLGKLETSNLAQANPLKYQEFKDRFSDLSKRVINSKTTVELPLALKSDYAKLSSDFDYYMAITGKNEVAEYRTMKVRDTLNTILNELSKDNYLTKEAELNYYLELLDKEKINYREFSDLINEIRYNIYKLRVSNNTYNTKTPLNTFIPFVLRDINTLLEGDSINFNIKQELGKYALDKNLIIEHFNEVIVLINLGFSKKDITQEEMLEYLTKRLYKEEDLRKEFKGRDSKIVQDLAKVTRSIIPVDVVSYVLTFKKEYLREYVFELCFGGYYKVGKKYHDAWDNIDVSLLLKRFKENGFSEVKYIAEGVIVTRKESLEKNYLASHLINLYRLFQKLEYDTYYLDCAVIAYLKDLELDVLFEYATFANNEYILDYLYKIALKNNNGKLLQSLSEADKQGLNL